jgi:hypothetical protein
MIGDGEEDAEGDDNDDDKQPLWATAIVKEAIGQIIEQQQAEGVANPDDECIRKSCPFAVVDSSL